MGLLLRFFVICFHKNAIVHPSLNNEQTRRDKRLFEKLRLEHLDQVIDPKLLHLFRVLSVKLLGLL
jgi:hypothetical protein